MPNKTSYATKKTIAQKDTAKHLSKSRCHKGGIQRSGVAPASTQNESKGINLGTTAGLISDCPRRTEPKPFPVVLPHRGHGCPGAAALAQRGVCVGVNPPPLGDVPTQLWLLLPSFPQRCGLQPLRNCVAFVTGEWRLI